MDSEIPFPDIALHGFTPVRRRDCDYTAGQRYGEQEKEWTAARCHRLLRALTSRVAILKKDLARFSSLRPDCDVSNQKNVKGGHSRGKKRRQQDDDLEWAQSKPKKRVKRTYTGRLGRGGSNQGVPKTPPTLTSSSRQKLLVAGEISVPTPILARARGDMYMRERPLTDANSGLDEVEAESNKCGWPQRAANDGLLQSHPSSILLEIRRKIPASRYTIYEGLYNGLETLLRSTGSKEPAKMRTGSRSLLSMCLRAVPRHIVQEDAMLSVYVEETGTKSAISTRDMSTEIYDDLENLGSSSRGWKQLRHVVRAHGVQVLGEAIRAMVLDIEFCRALIALCMNTSAREEAEVLLSSLLSSKPFPRPKTLHDPAPRPISMLWRFVEDTGRFSFQYQQLANLVSTGALPLEWLATKAFRPVWTGVIQRLSSSSMNSEAVLFLEEILPLLATAGSPIAGSEKSFAEAVSQTFSSLLTTLLSIIILSTCHSGASEDRLETPGGDYEHIAALLGGSLVQYKLLAPSDEESVLLFAANLLAQLGVGSGANFGLSLPESLFSHHLEDSDSDRDSSGEGSTDYADLIAFICSVARCCGRGASSTGFEHLEHLHSVLQRFTSDVAGENLMKCVMVDSAYAFAQQLPERKHLGYASSLDTKFLDRDIKPYKPLIPSTSDVATSGFRWEEGIGEWVMGTPIGNSGKKNMLRRDLLVREESPQLSLSPLPYLGRRKEGVTTTGFAGEGSLHSSDPLHTCTCKATVLVEPVAFDQSLGVQSYVPESDDELHVTCYESDDTSGSSTSASRSEGSSPQQPLSSPTPASCLGDEEDGRSPSIDPASRFTRRVLRRSQDWHVFDESRTARSPSRRSSSASYETEDDGESHHAINRAPRLRRRAVRSSQAWQVFDESDDELSFLSVSKNDERILEDITNTTSIKIRNACKSRKTKQPSPIISSGAITDSEDELCL